jgi:hypothetical protein
MMKEFVVRFGDVAASFEPAFLKRVGSWVSSQYDFGRPSTRSAICDRISCELTGAMRVEDRSRTLASSEGTDCRSWPPSHQRGNRSLIG